MSDHKCGGCGRCDAAGEDHGAVEAQAAPPSPTTDATPSEAQLAEWERLAAEATPGPWKRDPVAGCKAIKGGKNGPHRQSQYDEIAYTMGLADDDTDAANADLMVAARTAVPALVRALRDARAHAAAARREGWREGMLAAADHLAAMWDDGDQTPEGFDPQKTPEVVLLRALAKETHR